MEPLKPAIKTLEGVAGSAVALLMLLAPALGLSQDQLTGLNAIDPWAAAIVVALILGRTILKAVHTVQSAKVAASQAVTPASK
jgi:hypothetical protein